MDFGWVNRLVQRSHSDDVETVGQSANANSGLSRWFLCGRECPLHQTKTILESITVMASRRTVAITGLTASLLDDLRRLRMEHL